MDAKARIALLVAAQGAKKAADDLERVAKQTGAVGDHTERTGKRAGKARGAVSSFTKSIRGMARWAKYGVAALGGFALVLGKRSLDEWREAGKVNRVTAARIRSTGKAAGLSADEIGDMAASLSNLLGIDDEEIQGVANRLLTFTSIKGDIFKPALQAAMDMGGEMGNTMGAATMLGKALQDPVKGATALRRAGVNLTKQQQDQLTTWVEQGDTIKAQRWILKELKTEFGGTAKAQTDGLKRMETSWANVEESIGGVFGPALDLAGGKFATFADRKIIPLIDSIAGEMRRIWDPNSDDDLQARLDKSGNLFRTRLGPVWRQIRGDIDRANLDDKLFKAFGEAIPLIAEAAGKAGGRAMVAFAKGWWKATLWGKLITLAFLMGKFGAFAPLGKWAAKKFAEKFAPRLAGSLVAAQATEGAIGAAAAGSRSKWGGLGGKAGKLFGVAFAIAAVLYFKDDIERALEDIAPGPDATDPTDGEGQRRADEEAANRPPVNPGETLGDRYFPPLRPPDAYEPDRRPRAGGSSLRGKGRDLVVPVIVDGREMGRAVRRISLQDLLTESA